MAKGYGRSCLRDNSSSGKVAPRVRLTQAGTRRAVAQQQREYSCPLCPQDKEYVGTVSNLALHQRTQHSGQGREFKSKLKATIFKRYSVCKGCNDIFSSLTNHRNTSRGQDCGGYRDDVHLAGTTTQPQPEAGNELASPENVQTEGD